MATIDTDQLLLGGSVAAIGSAFRSKQVSVAEAVSWYLRRIEAFNQNGPALNAVKDVSGHAVEDAKRLDSELAAGRDRGPLHGVPILIKDNVFIANEYTTTAGVTALQNFVPKTTATLVHRLEAAGAIILGKTKLTEFADYVSDIMPAEFSGAGGVVRNPHGIPYGRGQGSSVGSASAVAAGFAPLAIGGETQNSIQTPASYSSVIGFKASVGMISRVGIMPLVPSQDAPGPLARCVDDAILVIAAIGGADPRDAVSIQMQMQCDRTRGRGLESLAHVRIGVPRIAMADREQFASVMPLFEGALSALSKAGAHIVDPCDLPSAEQMQEVRSCVFRTEFKAALNAFLEDHDSPGGISSLATLIRWNEAHPEHIPYGQSLLLAAEETQGLLDPKYLADRARDIALSRQGGIDAALYAGDADVLIAPMGAAAKLTGKNGGPTLAIPFGLDPTGTPFGVTLYTALGRDRLLLAVGRLVERAIARRVLPKL
jgi:amidase